MKQLDANPENAAPVPALRGASAFRQFWNFKQFWRSSFREQSGGTLVEFSVTLALLLTIIFGILDCSRALYFDHFVCYAAEEAARYAMVRGSTWNNAACTTTSTGSCTATSANVTSLVKSISTMGNVNNLTVATTWTGLTPTGADCSATNVNNSPGCVVQVKVSYSFSFVLPFLPKNALVLNSTSAVAIAE
jgi:Flp pilus assembly protein TadG